MKYVRRYTPTVNNTDHRPNRVDKGAPEEEEADLRPDYCTGA